MKNMLTIHLQTTFQSLLIRTIVIILTLGKLFSQGETIDGAVYSFDKKLPLLEADISVSGGDLGTTTNEKGQFSIELDTTKNYLLVVSMMGYKDTTINVTNDNNRTLGIIYLRPDIIELKQVHVDSHKDIYQSKTPSSISISGNKFQKNINGDLASTLNGESGLAIRSSGKATQRPILRGYSGDRFLITKDGVEIGDLSNSTADHAVGMEISAVESIEIIRGPETLIYGSNTVAGVINISSSLKNRLNLDKPKYNIVLGHENSNQSSFGGMDIVIPLNNYQFSSSLIRRESGNQSSPIGTLENTALIKNDYTHSITKFGRSSVSTFIIGNFSMEYGIPGSPEGHISGVDLTMSSNNQKFKYHSDINLRSFKVFDFEQGYIKYNHKEFVKNSQSPSVELSQNIFYFNALASSEKLKIGALFQSRQFLAGGFYWTPDTYERKLAVYGINEININALDIQFSVRAEYRTINPETSNSFYSNLNPLEVKNREFLLLSGGLSVSKNWDNFALYNHILYTSRAPKIEDLYSDGPHLGSYSYEIGDPNLNQENTIGFENTISVFNNQNSFNLTSYYNYSSNYHISQKMGAGYTPGADWIEWGSGPSGWLYKYRLYGLNTLIYGFEPSFTLKLDYFDLRGNASFCRGLDNENNRSLSYMPPDKIRFQIEKSISYFKNTLEMVFMSEQNQIGEFETQTDGYQLLNYSCSYTIGTEARTHKLIIQLNNILDQTYYNHLSKIKMIIPEPGINLNINYRINF